ncbi:dnaJ protein-like protein 2-like [Hibiscus syriacus]|uniref:DnaJ protein-like protein 2-like n=1 Tax=Hibiscus syriacus TaxID=106335 RepID=A0A6A3BXD7_HIBSY|nr:MATH domain and coiled-coil domain-containing protein At3g58370-like [Hibiscus syriacus]KAE8721254.1 dnaJ protein-like protein 2-like [Hibiscus syriacus]
MERCTREIPPAHYSFKIEGFSLLSDTKVEKIESGIFEAGGYKWRMVLYPNGNAKSNGKDFISLYLAIEETKSLPQRWEVNAEFKLFVFDQKENNYLTVQDSGDKRIKRFHEMKTEWGFSKLISLETLKNTSNYGYLCNGSCEFGAEIFVIKPCGKSECLSMIKNPDRSTLTWNLEKFSTLKETSYLSKPFTVGGRKWNLRVYPEGNGDTKGDWLSVYIILSDSDNLPPKGTVYAQYTIRVLDQRRDQHAQKSGKKWFSVANKSWGYDVVRLGDLHEKSKGFVMNDTLIIEAKITLISVTKSSH